MAKLTEEQLRENKNVGNAISLQTDYHYIIERTNGFAQCRDTDTEQILFDNKLMSFKKAFELWCDVAMHRDGNVGIAPF